MVWNYQKRWLQIQKINLLCYLLEFLAHFRRLQRKDCSRDLMTGTHNASELFKLPAQAFAKATLMTRHLHSDWSSTTSYHNQHRNTDTDMQRNMHTDTHTHTHTHRQTDRDRQMRKQLVMRWLPVLQWTAASPINSHNYNYYSSDELDTRHRQAGCTHTHTHTDWQLRNIMPPPLWWIFMLYVITTQQLSQLLQ